jgi:predicted ferric reductase
MNFPLSMLDIGLWLAVMAIILLITSELLYSLPEYSARVLIEKKSLRLVAIGSGLGFLVTVAVRIFQS